MNCWPSGKYVHLLYMYSILVGSTFALITASIRRGMEVISLWHCWGGMEAQVSLTVAFSSSALLGLVSLIFLLTIPHIFSMGFRSGEFAGQSSTVNTMVIEPAFGTFGSVGRCQILMENEISISIMLVSRSKHEALKCPGRWLRWLWTSEKHSGPTAADDMAAQIITDCGNFTLDFTQHGFCASKLLLQTLGPWFPN